jgi:ribosomal protein L29
MGHEELMSRVRGLLREAIEMRYQGTLHAKKVQAQAYADGYMRALSDARQVGRDELLQLVSEERAKYLAEGEHSATAAAPS